MSPTPPLSADLLSADMLSIDMDKIASDRRRSPEELSFSSLSRNESEQVPADRVADHLPPTTRVVLTGFMAAGKTTVARLLAARLGWRFADTDQEIESTAGMTVAEIFKLHGESSFRSLEREAIANLMQAANLVLALGGGAIEDDTSRELLLNSPGTCLVYLEASLATSLARCFPSTEDQSAGSQDSTLVRPLLSDRNSLEQRYQHRLPLYRLSHHSLQVDECTPEAVADAILTKLKF